MGVQGYCVCVCGCGCQSGVVSGVLSVCVSVLCQLGAVGSGFKDEHAGLCLCELCFCCDGCSAVTGGHNLATSTRLDHFVQRDSASNEPFLFFKSD